MDGARPGGDLVRRLAFRQSVGRMDDSSSGSAQPGTTMFRLLRVRPAFRRLWLAGTFSLIGDWLSLVAVSLLTVQRGGGALALATLLAVHALPHALLTPIAGVVADRFDRRKILVIAPLFQAGLTLLVALAASRGAVGLVQLLLLVRGTASAFVIPAEMASLRHTVEPDELMTANAVVSGTWSLTFVAGMALGGAIAVLGPVPAILLDSLSFLAAAALLRKLPAMPPEESRDGARAGVGELLRSVPADLWAALKHASARPELLRAVFSKAPVAVAGGAGWVVLNLVAGKGAFGAAALTLGVLQAVRGAGTGIGPLVVAKLPVKSGVAALAPHVAVGLALAGMVVFPLVESVPVVLLVVTLLWGMGSGANWVLSSSALQRLSPDRYIGRLSSVDDLATTATMVGGAFIGAAVLENDAGALAAVLGGAVLGLLSWVGLSSVGTSGAAVTAPSSARAASVKADG